MTLRRLASVSLLIVANLVVGFFYLQTKHPIIFSNDFENDTSPWNVSTGNRTGVNSTQSSSQVKEEKLMISKTKKAQDTPLSHPYHYIIENADLCSRGSSGKGKLPLVILVCSAVSNFANRQAIRETWGSISCASNNTNSVRLAFLLGSTENNTLQKLVATESSQHSDIIQEDFCDTYQNLTLKSVMLLKWVKDHCPNVRFVLKTDDDMYINVAKLLQTLTRLPTKAKVMYGTLFRKARPDRNKAAKWYVPKEQFQGDVFPDYLSGTAYVISRDVIPTLYEVSTTLPFLVMEDVFITGLCASQAGVRRYNVKGFVQWKRAATGCAFKDAISGHHVTVKDMKKIWSELKKPNLVCRLSKKGR